MTDLVKLYNRLRKKYFDELPKGVKYNSKDKGKYDNITIGIGWNNRKGSVGMAQALLRGNMIQTKSIHISKKYKLPGDKLIGVMLHEMIHIKIFKEYIYSGKKLQKMDNSERKGGHGRLFMRYRDELMKRSGYNIPPAESEVELSDDIKVPVKYLFVWYDRGQPKQLSVLPKKNITNNMEKIIRSSKLDGDSKYFDEIIVYETSHKNIQLIPSNRKHIYNRRMIPKNSKGEDLVYEILESRKTKVFDRFRL